MTTNTDPPKLTLPARAGNVYRRRDGCTIEAKAASDTFASSTHLLCVAGEKDGHLSIDKTHIFARTGRVSSLADDGADSPLDLVEDVHIKGLPPVLRQPSDFADVLHAIANKSQVQMRPEGLGDRSWINISHSQALHFITLGTVQPVDMRDAPRTIRVGDVDVPMAEYRTPRIGTPYWMINFDRMLSGGVEERVWSDDQVDEARLNRGLVHLSRENAKAHFKAVMKLLELPPL